MNEEYLQNPASESVSEQPAPATSPVPPEAPAAPPTPTYYGTPTPPAYPPTYPPVSPAAPQKQTNGLAVAALVCGIVSAALFCCCNYISILAGIAAIVLAICSRKDGKMSGMALAGLICGIVGLAIGILMLFISLMNFSSNMDLLNQLENDLLSEFESDGFYF